MSGTDDAEFDAWFGSLFEDGDEGDEPPSEMRLRLIKDWFRRLYEADGPVTSEVAQVAYQLDLMSSVEEALVPVLNDVRRTTSVTLHTKVDVPPGCDYLVIFDMSGSRSVAVDLFESPGTLLAEIAGEVQADVMDVVGVWPLCPVHGYGLHAVVRDAMAVWWCRFGDHSVAAVGDLPI